ncbi:uncharacterized protein VDAG_03108 [Verticillium dahliae VdLs.17]|uniref:Uncharacterized protein n=1 Tax=Verticillium dahliae (strain VdLs.17 / ATCC MYA-4575 / FGSC 10137) TaxID=498257 RepID=G2WYL6_VERDV|nr:uncharacterized protein VDAG_03108 [Verticillium dahliae VdLs.17]EGY21668.1 hypothetical protein VDAG_03108 [Verticillium dahliae VdLs.17]
MAPMATHDTVVIYAELLPNIRHISVAVSLPSPVDASTSVQTSAHGDSILVTHRGESTEARLPGPVSAPSALPIPATPPSGPTSLAWRLPVSTSVTLPSTRHELQPTVPWSAHDLTPKAAVACRQCGEAVVPEGRLHVWKDLPSENWAEMMDFWHCHKPHDHGQEKNGDGDHDDEHLTKRGYGANSSIAAQTRVGFVDLTSFFLPGEDSPGLGVISPPLSFHRTAPPPPPPPSIPHHTELQEGGHVRASSHLHGVVTDTQLQDKHTPSRSPLSRSPQERGVPGAMRTPLFFALAARATARFMWSSGTKRRPSQGPIRVSSEG